MADPPAQAPRSITRSHCPRLRSGAPTRASVRRPESARRLIPAGLWSRPIIE
jgi:hypothetical protein